MDGTDLQVVQFIIGGEEYAISISQVQEILRVPQITDLPRTESFVMGLTNIRGTVLSVMDLKRFLLNQSSELTENSRILVVEANQQKIALVVDEVTEVLTLPAEVLVSPEQIAVAINQDFLMGVARLAEKIVILLDIDRVCSFS